MKSTPSPLRSTSALLLAGALMLGVQSASATFKSALNLTNFNPDLFVSSLDISYTAGTGVLNLTGTGVSSSWTDSNGVLGGAGNVDYSLMATFSGAGSVLQSGSMSITANGTYVTSNGNIGDGQLLWGGTISDFGFAGDAGGQGTFEFLLGDLMSDVPGIMEWDLSTFGQVIATTTSALSTGDDSWLAGDVDFSGSGVESDNSVPLPATLSLVVLGLAGLGLARSTRRSSSAG